VKKECVAGCKVYDGGEKRHHKDCHYYPESWSKMYDDLKEQQKPGPSMDKWIEELEENARVDGWLQKGTLLDFPHLNFWPGKPWSIALEGDYTIQQLEALINHMKRYQK
jgi:hypothetical protein